MTMPPSERRHRRYEEHLTDAELNELVDGTLAPPEFERAQVHLASCDECAERYQTLQSTVSALKAAPGLAPRRSFQLTPEQAKIPQKPPSWLDRFSEWLVPGVPVIRAATLAVALLLLSVTAIDYATHRNNTSENAGPVVMRTTGDTDSEAPPVTANNAAPTSIPAQSEPVDTASDSSTGGLAQSAAQPTDAINAAEPAENESADAESFTSSAQEASGGAAPETSADDSVLQEASDSDAAMEAPQPPAPAAAANIGESTMESSGALGAMEESAPETPPSPVPTETATPSPIPTATASPIPPTATVEATPVSDGQSGDSGVGLSRWRIAEFGLLLLLVWLGVTWFGRAHMRDDKPDDDSKTI
jgi:hypothetical protein